jgi:hypothetical protein
MEEKGMKMQPTNGEGIQGMKPWAPNADVFFGRIC